VTIRLAELRAAAGSRFRLARRYLALGAQHILLGVDHLLFVLGLLLLVRSLGSLVKTITAFTVAHSLTLGAAVLGIVSVERGPVEAAIALSIVLLAREIVVRNRGATHLVHRWPWLVAFVFGLLHGLGFAGALGRIGLRTDDIPLALLSFNLGVEVGQLAFVAAVLAVKRMIWGRRQTPSAWVEPALGYSLGALATLWFFLRLPFVWGGPA
jgi:hydrogenase/urease accessory protein HupE